MKKFTLLLSVTLIYLLSLNQSMHAQSPRLVLVEEFTQASCPPCGDQNPAFNDLLNANPDKVKSLKYQVSWPGYDPMNLHNPAQVQTRVDYYGVNGVPSGFVDGKSIINDCGYYDGAPACLSQSDIDDANAVTSPFSLTLSHSLSADADSIYVTLSISAVASVSGTLRARIAVIEKEIDFITAPGTNGESFFENVMKQMIPNTTGTELPSVIDSGYSNTITASWKLANIYNLNELGAIAFIQNDDDKMVYQTAYSEPLSPALANYATVTLSVTNPITCTGTISPVVDITNLGTTTLTSATLTYSVGSGTPQTFDWTGSLAAGATATGIQLPAIAVPEGSGILTGYVSVINGNAFNAGLVSVVPVSVIGLGTPAASPIVENFALSVFPPSGWFISNPNASDTWIRSSTVGAYQISPLGAAKYPFYIVPEGDVDELFVQNFDFSDAVQTEAFLQFDYAKASYAGYNDQLKILASSDCGQTWITLFDKDDNSGLSMVTSTTDWKPTASHWQPVSLDMSQFIGQSNVEVKFQAISGFGNNLYVDNVNIHYGSIVGIASPDAAFISVYPNPANDLAVVHTNGITSDHTILEVLNVLGQVIYRTSVKSHGDHTINTSRFENGMYVYRLNEDERIIAQDKFNVSH